MLLKIIECFSENKVYYSRHARDEMEDEESGEILEKEIFEAVLSGKTIEDYPEDEPYPSCLIFGRTNKGRPLHIVCAYSEDEKVSIIITAYQPNPDRWIDFSRRKN